MPNSIKYKAGNLAGSLQKGNVALGVNSSVLGPTSSTGWYSGITSSPGKYIIYEVSEGSPPKIYQPSDDTQLIQFARSKGATGDNIENVNTVLNWIATQTNLMVVNESYPSVVTDQLGLALDGNFDPSYPRTGLVWYDVSGQNLNVGGGQFSEVNGSYTLMSNTNDAQTNSSNLLNTDHHSIQLILQFKGTPSHPNGWNGGWEQFIGYYSQGDDRSPGIWRFPDSRLIHWTYNPGNTSVNFGMNSNGSQFNLNQNFHICMVKNGGTGIAYVNGVEVLSTGVVNPKTSGDSVFRFFDYYTSGLMDIKSCFVYRKALSVNEIQQNYYLGPIITSGLSMALDPSTPCCNNTSTTITDLTTNQYIWTYEETVTRSQDFGGTLRLNNGRIYRDSIPWYGNYTFSFWVKMESVLSGFFYTENDRIGGGCARIYSSMNSNGTFTYQVWDNSSVGTFGTGNRSTTTTTNVQDGNWHHITCIWSNGNSNRSRGIYVFVDGQLEGSTDMIGNDGSYAWVHLGGGFGCLGTLSSNCFIGPVHHYSNIAFNNDQVRQNYNAQAARFR